MTVTATEFKSNFGKYLDISTREDVYISKNGKIISMVTKPKVDKIAILNSLVGIVPSYVDTDELKEERLSKK